MTLEEIQGWILFLLELEDSSEGVKLQISSWLDTGGDLGLGPIPSYLELKDSPSGRNPLLEDT